MAIAADVLLEESKCFCGVGASSVERLQLALLNRIALLGPAYNFIQRTGITDAAQVTAINQLVTNAQDHGWWSKCDLIYPFVGGTAGAHAQNLKSSGFTITWNGTVTHDANGITGDGATGYGDAGYIPSSSGQMLINFAHLSVYRRSLGTAFNRRYAGVETTDGVDFRGGVFPGLTSLLNSTVTGSNFTAGLGFCLSSRTTSAVIDVYSAGTVTAANAVSTNTPTIPLFILASNVAGVASLFSDSNLGFATIGSGISAAEHALMKADIQTFQTSLGRQV